MPEDSLLAPMVDEFVAMMHDHGVAVDRRTVEQEILERVAEIADRLDVSAHAVLHDHVQDGWGRQMAATVIAEIHRQGLLHGDEEAEYLSTRVTARLIAALGRAIGYLTANEAAPFAPTTADLRQAAEAIQELGQASDDTADGQTYVQVLAHVVAAARDILQLLHDRIRVGDWTCCPCGEEHGQRQIDGETLEVVRTALLSLPDAEAALPAHQDASVPGPGQHRLEHPPAD